MELAFKEGRQPSCVYCQNPLDKIVQIQYLSIEWEWSKTLKKYIKQDREGDSEKPYHSHCWTEDWAFVDEKLVSY